MNKNQIEKWVYANLGKLQSLVAEDHYELINEIASDILVVFNMPSDKDTELLLSNKIEQFELLEGQKDGTRH